MPVNDELGRRMKEYYEGIPNIKLMRRTPVAIRLDGKAFHTFTKGFKRPFDEILIKSMQETMKYLCENIQGCVFGYTQSDEITLILVDYKNLNSSAWFDYKVQKMCSIAASMATIAFNRVFDNLATAHLESLSFRDVFWSDYEHTLTKALEKGAMFDARVFNVPKEEVTNLVYWRQVDAIRNSVQMVGQTYFSDKELHKKSRDDIKNMLLTEKDIDWNDFPAHQKYSSCCIKTNRTTTFATVANGEVITGATERPRWIVDNNIPIFKDEGREYIEKLINF